MIAIFKNKAFLIISSTILLWAACVWQYRSYLVEWLDGFEKGKAAFSYGSAVNAMVSENYEEAFSQIDELIEDPGYFASIQNLPGVAVDPAYAERLEKGKRRLFESSDDKEKSEIAADMAEIWYSIGNRYYYRNQEAFGLLIMRSYLQSIVLCKLSIQFHDNARAHRQFGITLADLGTSESSIVREFNSAISLDPKDGYSLYKLGNAYSNAKDYPRAIEYLKQAIAADPTVEKAYINLANNYGFDGKKEEQMKAYGFALARCKSTCYVTYRNRGATEYEAGNYQAALTDFKKAVKDAKAHGVNYRYAYLGIWRVMFENGRYEEAIQNFVLSLNEKDSNEHQQDDWSPNLNQWGALMGIARSYQALGDYSMARNYALRAKYEKNTEEEATRFLSELASRDVKR